MFGLFQCLVPETSERCARRSPRMVSGHETRSACQRSAPHVAQRARIAAVAAGPAPARGHAQTGNRTIGTQLFVGKPTSRGAYCLGNREAKRLVRGACARASRAKHNDSARRVLPRVAARGGHSANNDVFTLLDLCVPPRRMGDPTLPHDVRISAVDFEGNPHGLTRSSGQRRAPQLEPRVHIAAWRAARRAPASTGNWAATRTINKERRPAAYWEDLAQLHSTRL